MTDDLTELLTELDAKIHRFTQLEAFYAGRPPLAYLSKEAKVALQKFDLLSVNVSRLQINSITERLRINGFSGVDIWPEWERNDLPQLSSVAHREALLYGESMCLVWADAQGRPQVTIESPRNVIVRRDPITRQINVAAKRVRTKASTLVWLYYPDRVESWFAKSPSAGNVGFDLVDVQANPLSVVPIVQLVNVDLLDGTVSELDDLIPLVQALDKLILDMLIASEYSGRPRRFAVGVEAVERPKLDADGNVITDDDGVPITETVNPFPEENRMMLAEKENAKIGQLPAADLSGFESGVRVIVSALMAVSSLPSHYLGVLHSQPTSSDAIRSSEASLTARCELKQATFSAAWEQVGRLVVAVRDGVDVADVEVRVVWNDPATRSVAQESDAALKLFAAGILSRRGVLKRLGLSDVEIDEELAHFNRDAQDSADIALGRFASSLSSHKPQAA
jgi:hypothetical protein